MLPDKPADIPKPDGRQRPLAVAALEDKIIQRATAAVLNAIYEETSLGGFGPAARDARVIEVAQEHEGIGACHRHDEPTTRIPATKKIAGRRRPNDTQSAVLELAPARKGKKITSTKGPRSPTTSVRENFRCGNACAWPSFDACTWPCGWAWGDRWAGFQPILAKCPVHFFSHFLHKTVFTH
jgi:hypothetical protein